MAQHMLVQVDDRQGPVHGRLALVQDDMLCGRRRFPLKRHHGQASGNQIWDGHTLLVGGRLVSVHDKLVSVHGKLVSVHGKLVSVPCKKVLVHGKLALAHGRWVWVQHNCQLDEQDDGHDASCEPCVDTSSCSSWAC